MKGFKSTSTNPYSYTQDGVWKKGQYTFQAVVLSDSGYAFAFQRSNTTWQTVDLSWQVKDGSYSKIQWTFTLEVDAVAFRLIANTVTGETTVLQPMLEKGTNGSTPIAHEEDLRGMDGDNHEFIFTRNDTGIAPDAPLSTQDDDYVPDGWTDNPQGVTKELPFEFVSMREKKVGVWLDFSPPSLWAKWGEDGLSVNLHVEGHYNSKWVGVTKVTEIIGGVDVGGSEVVKVSAVFRKGETNIAATEAQSRGFQWYVNNVHLTEFDDQPYITLDETYGDGFADYVVLSYLVNSLREEERREILNVSEGMDGIGEEFIFKAHDDGEVAPVLPQTTDEGYQNDDYHGDWHDDPVAPTEVLQFVWVAKRKKVGGEWQAFGVPSVWTKWVTDGEDGTGILDVVDWYAISTSGTTAPGTGWQTTLPSKPANYYLWNYEVITYTDGRTPTETQKRVIQGKDARSIYDIKNAYAYSASDTVSPTSGWQYSIAALGAKPAGYFLWVREDIAYTDNPSNYISTVGYVVRDGADGVVKTISLSATTKAIHITEGNIPIPTSVTVTGTAKNTTIQYWYYSVDGASSFTSSTPTGVSRSSNVVTINSSTAKFKTLSIKARNSADDVEAVVTITRGGGAPYVNSTTNTWWAWDDATGAFTDTGMSPVGHDGAIPYPAGYYDNSKWYRREDGYAPYVQYGEVLYLLILDTPSAGIPTSNTTYWKAFNQWEAVFVTSLVAKFAKIGGAVFTGDTSDTASAIKGRMISEMGSNGSTNYESYTGDGGAWQPKLMLDFLTGKVKALDGEIGDFRIDNGRLTSSYFWDTYIGTTLVHVTSDIEIKHNGIVISSSYGGTTEHPQVVEWSTEITPTKVRVGNMEMRRDGIYRDNIQIL